MVPRDPAGTWTIPVRTSFRIDPPRSATRSKPLMPQAEGALLPAARRPCSISRANTPRVAPLFDAALLQQRARSARTPRSAVSRQGAARAVRKSPATCSPPKWPFWRIIVSSSSAERQVYTTMLRRIMLNYGGKIFSCDQSCLFAFMFAGYACRRHRSQSTDVIYAVKQPVLPSPRLRKARCQGDHAPMRHPITSLLQRHGMRSLASSGGNPCGSCGGVHCVE